MQQHRRPQQQTADLIDDDISISSPPVRPNTVQPASRPPPPPDQSAPKQNSRPGESLLGLDFFGGTETSAPTNRSGSALSNPPSSAGMSRPDLKQSILSLYSKPPPAPAQRERSSSFGELASPTAESPPPPPLPSSNLGGLTDAFSGLSLPAAKPTSLPAPKPAEKSPTFANLPSFTNAKSTPAPPQVTSRASSASGGSIFDRIASPPLAANPPPAAQARAPSISSNGFDSDFTSYASAKPAASPTPPPALSLSADLFDTPAPSAPQPPARTPSWTAAPEPDLKAAFNISNSESLPREPKPSIKPSTSTVSSMLPAGIDEWGGNAWSTPDPIESTEPEPAPSVAPPASSTTAASMMKLPDHLTANDVGSGWAMPSTSGSAVKNPAPTVAVDEDFGGWTSAVPPSSVPSTTATQEAPASSSKPGGGFGGADELLFSNVWE